MEEPKLSKNIDLALRIITAIAFLGAGAAKQLERSAFVAVLIHVFEFSPTPSFLIASILPVIEISIGLGILFKPTYFVSLVSSTAISSLFVAFHFWNFIFKDGQDCFCYGAQLPGGNAISFIVALIVLSIATLLLRKYLLSGIHSRISASMLTIIILLISTMGLISYSTISEHTRIGIAYNVGVSGISDKLARTLSRLIPAESTEVQLKFVIFLGNPNCNKCISELLFWNELTANDSLLIVAVVPTRLNLDLSQYKGLLNLHIGMLAISSKTETDLFGDVTPLIARFAVARNGRLKKVSTDNEMNEKEIQEFISFAQDLP